MNYENNYTEFCLVSRTRVQAKWILGAESKFMLDNVISSHRKDQNKSILAKPVNMNMNFKEAALRVINKENPFTQES